MAAVSTPSPRSSTPVQGREKQDTPARNRPVCLLSDSELLGKLGLALMSNDRAKVVSLIERSVGKVICGTALRMVESFGDSRGLIDRCFELVKREKICSYSPYPLSFLENMDENGTPYDPMSVALASAREGFVDSFIYLLDKKDERMRNKALLLAACCQAPSTSCLSAIECRTSPDELRTLFDRTPEAIGNALSHKSPEIFSFLQERGYSADSPSFFQWMVWSDKLPPEWARPLVTRKIADGHSLMGPKWTTMLIYMGLLEERDKRGYFARMNLTEDGSCGGGISYGGCISHGGDISYLPAGLDLIEDGSDGEDIPYLPAWLRRMMVDTDAHIALE